MLSRLYTLLLAVAISWSSLVVFGVSGIVVIAVVLISAVEIYRMTSRWSLAFYLFVIMFGGLLLFSVLMNPMAHPLESNRRPACLNNLKQIGMALYDYYDVHHCFPPAHITDKNGKLMHSWRVLILPYLCDGQYKNLYKQYNFNEPWNGPRNRKLLSARPAEYACPSDENACAESSTQTSYAAVVGTNAAWSAENPKGWRDSDLTGKLGRTIMLVEIADAGINWTEPEDLPMDAPQAGGSSPSRVTVSSKHMRHNSFFYHDTVSGVNVLMADGSARFLSAASLTADQLPNLLKIGGCRDEDADASWDESDLRIHWPHCAALAVWIVSVSLLLYRAVRSRRVVPEPATENAD